MNYWRVFSLFIVLVPPGTGNYQNVFDTFPTFIPLDAVLIFSFYIVLFKFTMAAETCSATDVGELENSFTGIKVVKLVL